jgi:TPR repeat protein
MKNNTILMCFLFAGAAFAGQVTVIPQSLLDEVEQGNAEVAYFIANTFLDGTDNIEVNEEKGIQWLVKSAELGSAHAMNELGIRYHKQEKQELALSWYKKAAEQGVADAFGAIASYFMSGFGGLEQSCQQAYEWYEKAEARKVKLAFNNHAWYLATASEKECRNPEKALMIFLKLKSIYKSEEEEFPWTFKDTEAAVFASISNFGKAIEVQQGLIKEVASFDVNVESYQKHLQSYLQRKPWVEPSH